MANPSKSSSRIPSLDGLRCVSIFFVICAHLKLHEQSGRVWRFFEFFGDASIGVTVFFVISGYLITTLLLREEKRDRRISLSSFYWRRIFRILPALAVYLVTIVLIDLLHPIQVASRNSYLGAATLTVGYWPDAESWVFAHFWSLSIEEQFYLFWPVAFFFARGRGRVMVCLVFVVLAPLGRAFDYKILDEHSYSRLYSAGDTIMYGCLLALWLDRSPGIVERRSFHARLFRLVALLSLYAIPELRRQHMLGPFTVLFGHSSQSIAIAYLIATYTREPGGLDGRFLNWRPVEWIGRISYSLYLWQQLFLFQADPVFGGWALTMPGRLFLVFATAAVSYYLVEQPMLRVRARFLAWRAARNGVARSSNEQPAPLPS